MRKQASVYQRVCKNLVASETQWARQTEDLAALAPDAEHGWFNGFLEDMLNNISTKALLVSRALFLSWLVPKPSHPILGLLAEITGEPIFSSTPFTVLTTPSTSLRNKGLFSMIRIKTLTTTTRNFFGLRSRRSKLVQTRPSIWSHLRASTFSYGQSLRSLRPFCYLFPSLYSSSFNQSMPLKSRAGASIKC